MEKYYTRACNFYYGVNSKNKIKEKLSLPLNGNNLISFDYLEIISRKSIKKIHIKEIKLLPKKIKKKIFFDLKKITKKKYFKNLKFKKRPLLMGILNTTPDSFSDGGKYLKNHSAKKKINKFIKEGVSIIDIGGESTRPGAKDINYKVEFKRIENKLKFLMRRKCFISVDTRKSEIMKRSIKFNVGLINDVSGLSYDKNTINILKEYKVPFVIHHTQGNPKTMQINPKYKNVLLDIYDFFEERIKFVRSNNIKHNNIILDPGIGFGKNLKHNITLISNISIFHSLGFPVMLGISKKKFIKDLSKDNDSKERIGGTLGTSIYCASQGVQVLRVHDVNEIQQGLKVFDKLKF